MSAANKFKLTAIVAMTAERVIGKDGGLPWRIPEDLKFFKQTTLGSAVVMGRKTYESIGKPLPQRRNVVLTRDPAWRADGVEVIREPQDLWSLRDLGAQVFIIGGAQVYAAYLPYLDDLVVSLIHDKYAGSTIFPEYQHEFPVREWLATFPQFTAYRFSRKPKN